MIEIELLPTIKLKLKTRYKSKVQDYLMYLLALLSITYLPCFYQVSEAFLGLNISIFIDGAKFIGREVIFDFSRYIL